MKTITPEIKARIFAPYMGVEFECISKNIKLDNKIFQGICLNNKKQYALCLFTEKMNFIDFYDINEWIPLLTTIEQISDEDIIAVDVMEEWNGTETGNLSQVKIMIYNGIIHNRGLKINSYQYLLSKGYALPYMDYSVEDLIELGVYKLKQ
jgi:hypothetical protein